jgi:hypothetical protein
VLLGRDEEALAYAAARGNPTEIFDGMVRVGRTQLRKSGEAARPLKAALDAFPAVANDKQVLAAVEDLLTVFHDAQIGQSLYAAVQKIPVRLTRAQAAVQAAQILAVDQPAFAREFLQSAMSIVGDIESPHDRELLQTQIASLLIQLGMIDDAYEIARQIESDESRYLLLTRIAQGWASRSPARTAGIVDEISKALETLPDESREKVQVAVMEYLIGNAPISQALETAQKWDLRSHNEKI